VRYALRSANAPMVITTYSYEALPPAEQAALPAADAITAAFTGIGQVTGTADAVDTGAIADAVNPQDGPRQ
jgi:hypothetical protein